MPNTEDDKPGEGPRLRTGFSTGTAATAAALAAVELLLGRKLPAAVMVRLPIGRELRVAVAEGRLIAGHNPVGEAVVVKDAGDDPDVTHGARIGARVRRSAAPGLTIAGGPGVGRVTKPGLVVPPGQWAINPGPQGMLRENLALLLNAEKPAPGELSGLAVEIFVERGEELAKKTLNPRLGILGGISILGTTGLVKPFSHSAYTATLESAFSMARAGGVEETVLTTGGQSENLAMKLRPELPPEAFVQIADFFKEGLRRAARRGFKTIGLAIFFGKAVKQAAGLAYTHAHQNDLEVKLLADWLPGLPEQVAEELGQALTARAALDILRAHGLLGRAPEVAERVLAQARKFAGAGPDLWVVIFDYDGAVLAEVKEEE